ncbi:MAG: HIT family protein [Moraxellaceae bacterium]|nr:HIT family protein [Moraxellaceae bacterium]
MSDCVFCAIIAKKSPASIVYEDELCMVLMDIFPLRPAHVLVINKRHVQYVRELSEQERNHLFATANKVSQAIVKSSLQALAVHFNINDGKAAHQTVPHVHLHILPRYKNDSAAFVSSLLAKPLLMLKGGANRKTLDNQAQEIAKHLQLF